MIQNLTPKVAETKENINAKGKQTKCKHDTKTQLRYNIKY